MSKELQLNDFPFHKEIDTSPSYDKNPDGSEIYKISSENHQLYRYKDDVGPIYAKDRNDQFFYARDADGVEQYGIKNNINLETSEWKSDVVIINDGLPLYRKNELNQEEYGVEYFTYDKDLRAEFYSKNSDNEQVYVRPPKFAKDKHKNDFYAKDRLGNDYYFDTEIAVRNNGIPFYAKKKDKSEFYPENSNKKQIYLKKEVTINNVANTVEVYALDRNNKQLYAKEDGVDYLATISDGSLTGQHYANESNNDNYYPKNRTGSEFYAKDKDENFFFARVKVGNQFKQIYCKDADNNEMYFESNPEFAKGADGLPYYARNKTGLEIYPRIGNTEIVIDQGVYTQNRAGEQFYPKKNIDPQTNTGDEFYCYIKEQTKHYAKYAEGPLGKKYCKDRDLNEFYPENPIKYIINNHKYIYCIDKDGFVIYPVDSVGNQFYFGSDNSYYHLAGKKIKNYAKFGNRYKYPTESTHYGVLEKIVNGVYLYNDEFEYPRDEFGSEYAPFGIIPALGLPITSDGFEIASDKANPQIEKVLTRSFQTDFVLLTNVKSSRVPRLGNFKQYETQPFQKTLKINVVPPATPHAAPTVQVRKVLVPPSSSNPQVSNPQASNSQTQTLNPKIPSVAPVLPKTGSKSNNKLWLFIIVVLCLISCISFKMFYLK